MKPENRITMEVGAGAAAATTAAWTLQDVSAIAAIIVSGLSAIWLLLQIIRFCVRWYEHHKDGKPSSFQETEK